MTENWIQEDLITSTSGFCYSLWILNIMNVYTTRIDPLSYCMCGCRLYLAVHSLGNPRRGIKMSEMSRETLVFTAEGQRAGRTGGKACPGSSTHQ